MINRIIDAQVLSVKAKLAHLGNYEAADGATDNPPVLGLGP